MDIGKLRKMPGRDLNGPIRPLLAFMFGLTLCLGFWFDKITEGTFIGIAALVIGWFFKGREDEKKEEQVTQRVNDQIKLITAPAPEPKPNGK